MKLHRLAVLAALTLLAACGDSGSSILSDPEYRAEVLADYEHRCDLLARCAATSIVDDPSLNTREREALQFLYAYMPLSDALNYDGDYFLRNVRLSERTRREMPWGKLVPDELYRHFVLPVRANNEDLDDFREAYYDELSARVRHLSMSDAILEINHWCHEKATYAPTDSRTAGPLSSIRATVGRCGEESTLLVAALRTVGIPARQVYTPRWAHTDDNHAWVEAWADGAWHFLGACEPEPVLDLGWFNGPASRGMLICTNVFGRYDGPEQVLRRTNLLTEINITENYAPTAALRVRVVDAAGNLVPGATVEYKLYNYAELYSVATLTSDSAGGSRIIAGRGDLLVWASKEDRFGFAKVSVGDVSEVTVRLDKSARESLAGVFTLTPPAEHLRMPEVSDAQRAENTRRMAVEDSLRNAYIATFRTEAQAWAFARAHDLDSTLTARHLVESKGNYPEIEAFLAGAAADGLGDRALMLLGMLTAKDLHDTSRATLDDHLRHVTTSAPRVLNPRVGSELLSAYRSYLQEQIPAEDAARFRADPQTLVAWCRDSLRMADADNLRLVPIRPRGVWASRVADAPSRDLFFVAVCRSLEIPAWRDAVTGDVWYTHEGRDQRVDFGNTTSPSETAHGFGRVKLNYSPTPAVPDPRYYTHFTLSRLEGGRLHLLTFGEDESWESTFRDGVGLDAGDYLLVSGTRQSDGSVSTRIQNFTVTDGATTDVPLVLPAEQRSIELLGTFDPEVTYRDAAGEDSSLRKALGNGYAVVGILGAGEEPTNHALHDIASFCDALESLGYPIVLLFSSEENALRFEANAFPSLPMTTRFGIDTEGAIRSRLTSGAGLTRDDLPLLAVVDGDGQIFYISSGYSIGLGERLVKELTAL